MQVPVVKFAYNRRDSLMNLITSLKSNRESSETDLSIYVDGARNDTDEVAVMNVRNAVKNISGFKSVTLHFSDENKGLAESIINGVTEVFETYDRLIVLEDDLVVSRSFLKFMNQMFEVYESDNRIMQIAGYGTKITVPDNYPFTPAALYQAGKVDVFDSPVYNNLQRLGSITRSSFSRKKLESFQIVIKSMNAFISETIDVADRRKWASNVGDIINSLACSACGSDDDSLISSARSFLDNKSNVAALKHSSSMFTRLWYHLGSLCGGRYYEVYEKLYKIRY